MSGPGHFDANALAAWAAVATAGLAGLRFHAKAARWFESVDRRFKDQGEINEKVQTELTDIRNELKPNHGSSHHDIVLREIRAAVEEVARSQSREGWRHRW